MTRIGRLLLVGLVLLAAAGVVRSFTTDPPRRDRARTAAIRVDAPAAVRKEQTVNATTTPEYSRSAYRIAPLSADEVDALASKLTDEQRRIILNRGTEPSFCGDLLDNKKEGVYVCRLCGLPLFSSEAKFTSGTGWPSFYKPFDPDHIRNIEDNSFGMKRVEIRCARCDGHLGHVFPDGPEPTGLRYCLNSASLEFFEKGAPLPERSRPIPTETAYFAGGCFWGVEDRFQHVPGVIDAVSGYQGGHVENPSYEQVCTDKTGHAESVRVVYDPSRVTYRELLERFFEFHNPTQLNRQGPDFGTQYRSALFPVDEKQRREAEAFIAEQNTQGRWAGKVVTRIEPFAPFYEAEAYHQDYNARHGRSCPAP